MIAQIEKKMPVEESTTATIVETRHYTPEEYLEMEIEAEERHEYRNGEIIPMAGGLPNRNRITRNLCTAMTLGLRDREYEVFVADQRLWIPQDRLYTYPDVMVTALPLELQEGRKDTVINPILIVEVLSKSTADYDRTDKFAAYRTIPSFQEYLLVDQYCQQIDRYVKHSEKKWELQIYDKTDTVVQLKTIDLALNIADIYDKVDFIDD
jgi:Uma2 family endonuclease